MDNRIRELEESLAATLGFLPEIDIATSIVVVAVVVAGLTLLARRPDVALRTRQRRESRQRRKAMHSSPTSTHSGGTGFSIRWGRLGIFAVGALSLITVLISGLAGTFGAGTWLLAGISLLITAACYGILRGLVILDSKKRAREREQLTISEGLETSIATYTTDQRVPSAVRRNDEVFDFADEPEQQQAIEEETEEPVADAPAPIPARIPLPRPIYLDAPEVQREAPRPLDTPQDPLPSRDVQLSEGVSSEYQEKISEKANTRLDLDKVLNRRRAI
ncbi:hypothetical protein [Enteractinococcus coprophilus]|uniref:Uncharacterized protein n=1 Tax=Enteractinococcus coprophilus TaxID=1027633 RepID=A0A543A0C7_9MICC|nr:hypothetical protein [Enteractinococcus coprophilus]TQL66062.1 hypothetical protein FB556_2541 [Enteractinococcus coprophilus]